MPSLSPPLADTPAPVSFAPLYIVGLGPGDRQHLTGEAAACIESCDVICGYTAYIALLDITTIKDKTIISTGMMGEIARTKAAINAAVNGQATAIVCSGDPGVYALAGLALELMEQEGHAVQDFPLHIVPGVPAVCAAAALLGAPLMHDFACVSLSDLLTPWETILHRLDHACAGDFVLALYNPRSKRRADYLEKAIAIALKYRTPDTPVGIVRNAFRREQRVDIQPLGSIDAESVDMFTILILGSSTSRIVPGHGHSLAWEHGARMLTPRGYLKKYGNSK